MAHDFKLDENDFLGKALQQTSYVKEGVKWRPNASHYGVKEDR